MKEKKISKNDLKIKLPQHPEKIKNKTKIMRKDLPEDIKKSAKSIDPILNYIDQYKVNLNKQINTDVKYSQPENYPEDNFSFDLTDDIGAPENIKISQGYDGGDNYIKIKKNNSFILSTAPMRNSVKPPKVELKSEECGLCKSSININNDQYFKFKSDRKTFALSCKNCYEKLFKCSCCDNLFANNSFLKLNHCERCIAEIPKNHSYLRVYNDKSENHFGLTVTSRKPELKFNSESAKEIFGENDPRSFTVGSHGVSLKLLGVELEYMVKKNLGMGVLISHTIIKDSGLKAIIKRDGTLKDAAGNDNGFEVVSCPADKNYHYYAWEPFFHTIEKEDNIYCADYIPPVDGAEKGTGCGCHIHISKDAMVHNDSYGKNIGAYGLAGLKLQTFIHYPGNRKFIEVIAGRPSNMFSDWIAKKGIQFKGNRIISAASDITKVQLKMDHRTAINFNTSNQKTIEFRIFRSTKSYDELRKNIDFVDAACSFCRVGVASIEDMRDWVYFYEFVTKNRQDYPYLYKFFDNDNDFLKLYKDRCH